MPITPAPVTPVSSSYVTETTADATYVKFVDHLTGAAVSASVVKVKVNQTTGEIDDIVVEDV